MTDYLTALAAVLDSVTRPEFAIIVGPIAVVAGLFIWAEHRADRINRAREEEKARTLAFAADPVEQSKASASYLAHVERMRDRKRRDQKRVFDDVLGPVDGGAA